MSNQPIYSIARAINKKISIIATHNARLRCLLRNFVIGEVPDYDKIRFKNCAILRLSVKINENGSKCDISLKMVYDGAIDQSENKDGYVYFKSSEEKKSISRTKSGSKSGSKKSIMSLSVDEDFGLIDIILNTNLQKTLKGGGYTEIDFPKIEKKNVDVYSDLMKLLNISTQTVSFENLASNEYVFYLVRHGQAEHNIYKDNYSKAGKLLKSYKTPDTPLTENGVTQAVTAGKELKKILEKYNESYYIGLYNLFVSDLKRTHHTLAIIFSNLFAQKLGKLDNLGKLGSVTAYVLPCSHELEFTGDNCDGKQGRFSKLAGENRMCCKSKSCGKEIDKQCNIIENDSGISMKIEWDFYNEFYNYNLSDRVYGKQKKLIKTQANHKPPRKCADSNMLIEAINAIGEIEKQKQKTKIN